MFYKDKKNKVSDFKFYVDKRGEFQAASAIINGVEHCTGDLRTAYHKINKPKYCVFSKITSDDMLKKCMKDNLECGLLTVEKAEFDLVTQDMEMGYLYVYIK